MNDPTSRLPPAPGPHDEATLPPGPRPREDATLPPSSPDAAATLAPDGARPTDGGDARAPAGYAIEKELGRGGMGVVYLARSLALQRPCALKMILSGAHSGTAEIDRFKTEAQAIARLQHPGIVQVFEVGEHDGRPFMALEYCGGGSLDGRLAKGPLKPREAAALVRSLAEAVQAAHEAQVIHRDLKPANVLLTQRGEPKVTDFGLAKKLDEGGATRTGSVMGTPSYMPPEQAEGSKDVGPAADVYALGAILYECLASRPPFKAATALDTILQVLTEDPVPLRQLNHQAPADLETICAKCLRKEPGKRYASARELADDLGRYLAGEPIMARPVGAVERATKWVRRNAAVSTLAAVVLQVLAGGVAAASWFAYRAGEEARTARRAEEEAEVNRRAATEKGTEASREADAARAQARRAEEARHAIQVGLALAALAQGQGGKVAAILNDVRPEYHGVWETCYVRGLWTGEGRSAPELLNHGMEVRAVAISRDGSRIVTACDDGKARVWEADTAKLALVLEGHKSGVTGVAFSPDGSRVLTGSWDRTVRVWDARTGAQRARFDSPAGVEAVAYCPDGQRILAGCSDMTARQWDVGTGRSLPALKGDALNGNVLCVAYSPDGKLALTGTLVSQVCLWDAATGTLLASLVGHKEGVQSAAFSPDGTLAATAGHDGTTRLWDVSARRGGGVLKGHTGGVSGVAFSPDGRRLLTAGADRTARLWDVVTAQEKLSLQVGDGLTCAAFSPDGRRIAAGGGRSVRLWGDGPGREQAVLRGHVQPVTRVMFCPSERRVLTASTKMTLGLSGEEDSTARLWDAASGERLALLEGNKRVACVAFSRDGERFLIGSEEGAAWVGSSRTGKRSVTLVGHTNTVLSAAFSPDGERIATGGADLVARIWDARTGKCLATLEHSREIDDVAFSPDGDTVLTGCRDHCARTWDARTGKPRAKLEGHAGMVRTAEFSPDGKRVVTASQDRTARVWEAATGKPLVTLAGHVGPLSSAAFRPDGDAVLTTSLDGTVRLWEARTGKEKACVVKAGQGDAVCAAFSPDGERVVTGGDSVARVWDVRTERLVIELKGHAEAVTSVAFSADGKRVATGSVDGTARLWDARPETKRRPDRDVGRADQPPARMEKVP